MIFAAFMALACFSFIEAEAFQRCSELSGEANVLEVLKEVKTMYYVSTNHPLEECGFANYTTTEDGNGLWIVTNSTGRILMHAILKPGDGNKFTAKVRETGATYNLGMTAYQQGQSFCWFQCDDNGDYVDFWHCFSATDESAKPEMFEQLFNDAGLKYDEFTTILNVYNSGCTNYIRA